MLIAPTGRVVLDEEALCAGEDRILQERTIADDLTFAFALLEKEELSAYERRWMRRFVQRFSREDGS